MKYLGVDYGLSKVGIAVSDGKIAEPAIIIRYADIKKLVAKIDSMVKKNNVETIVLGLSEGRMAQKTRDFGDIIKEQTGLTPIYQDETLSTLEAQTLSVAAGHSSRKRRRLEDAFAATLILQAYLDLKNQH